MELAVSRGYEGTTLSLISKRSGMPIGSIYWHFANKDALFKALIDHTYEQWMASAWPGEMSSNLRDKMLALLTGAADEHDPSQGFWRLGLVLTLERGPGTELARGRFQEIRLQVREMLAGDWRQSLPPDLVTAQPDFPDCIAEVLMAAADGLYIAVGAGESAQTARVLQTLIDAIEALVSQNS